MTQVEEITLYSAGGLSIFLAAVLLLLFRYKYLDSFKYLKSSSKVIGILVAFFVFLGVGVFCFSFVTTLSHSSQFTNSTIPAVVPTLTTHSPVVSSLATTSNSMTSSSSTSTSSTSTFTTSKTTTSTTSTSTPSTSTSSTSTTSTFSTSTSTTSTSTTSTTTIACALNLSMTTNTVCIGNVKDLSVCDGTFFVSIPYTAINSGLHILSTCNGGGFLSYANKTCGAPCSSRNRRDNTEGSTLNINLAAGESTNVIVSSQSPSHVVYVKFLSVPAPPPQPSTRNISGIWINTQSSLAVSGDLSLIPTKDIDFIILASYSPDPLQMSCNPTNVFGMMPGGQPITLAKTIRSNTPNIKSRIIISVGGSSFGPADFCNLAIPYITDLYPEIKNCSMVLGVGTGGGPCNTTQGFMAALQSPGAYSPGNLMCVQNATANTTAWLNYFPGNKMGTTCSYNDGTKTVANFNCFCCCGYNFLYNATAHALNLDPCEYFEGSQTPPPVEANGCGVEWADAKTNSATMTNLMYYILTTANLDGIDFDYESVDSLGYIAAGLVRFASQLKAKYFAEGAPAPFITMTTFAGVTYGSATGTVGTGGNAYTALYNCYQQVDCPIDFAVPMIYDNCMYQSILTNTTGESFDPVLQKYVIDPYPVDQQEGHGGFFFETLMDVWANTFTNPLSSTQLIVPLSFIQHWNRFPCEYLVGDIEAVMIPKYIRPAIQGPTQRLISGAFFWYYETPCNNTPTEAAFEYNNTLTTHGILTWQATFPNTEELIAPAWSWMVPPRQPCSLHKAQGITGCYIADSILTNPFDGPAEVTDYVMIDSFQPNIFTANCSSSYFLFVEGVVDISQLFNPAISDTLVALSINGLLFNSKPLISLGGSGFDITDWCSFLEPFFQIQYPTVTCNFLVGAPNASAPTKSIPDCHSNQASRTSTQASGYFAEHLMYDDFDINNASIAIRCICTTSPYVVDRNWNITNTNACVLMPVIASYVICNSTNASKMWTGSICNSAKTYTNYNAYEPVASDVNTSCCCDNPLENGGCPSFLPNTPNAPNSSTATSSCNWTMDPTGVNAANLTDAYVKVWHLFLNNYNLAGIDFDFEQFDSFGYMALGLVEFARQFKLYDSSKFLSITLMAGPQNGSPNLAVPKMGSGYTPFFNCFNTQTCPFDIVVPMLYDICSYPRRNTPVAPGDPATVTDPCVDYSGGFNLDGLVELWTTSLYGCSNTALVFGVTTELQDSSGRTPCSVRVEDMAYLKNMSSGGIFFWEIPMSGSNFNTDETLARINAWKNA